MPHASTPERLCLAAWLLLATAGVALCTIDLLVHRLPTPLIAGIAATTLPLVTGAAILAHHPAALITAALAASVVGLGHLALAVASPSRLGLGDVRLAALLGGLLGTHGWHLVVLGMALPYILATPVIAVALALHRGGWHASVPFGAPMFAGAIAAVLITAT